MAKLSILREMWQFIRLRKKYWLIPVIVVLLLVGVLLFLTEGSAIAPFIYTLF
jgi:competence protein ComGC